MRKFPFFASNPQAGENPVQEPKDLSFIPLPSTRTTFYPYKRVDIQVGFPFHDFTIPFPTPDGTFNQDHSI
jgi:hypothetical protein